MASEKFSQLNLLWWLRDADTTPGSAKLVLMMLILRSNEKDQWSCYPSIPQIAEDCKISESSVQRALRKLERLDMIKTTPRPYTTPIYSINVRKLWTQFQAGKKSKPEIHSPYGDLTIEQEHQLDADEAKVAFDDRPAADPVPAEKSSADPASDEEPDAPEPSPVSAAIQALKYVNEKMSVKQADVMARSLLRSHAEDKVIQAIASLDAYALGEACKAENTIGYLRRSINNALNEIENPEPTPQNIESCTEDEGSESGEALCDLEETTALIQAIVDDDAPSENRWGIPTFFDEDTVTRYVATIAELSRGIIKVRGPFAIDWDDDYWATYAGATSDRALFDRYIVLVKAENKTAPQNIESSRAADVGEDEYADEPVEEDVPEEEDESKPIYFSRSPDGEVTEISEVEDEPVTEEIDPNIYLIGESDYATLTQYLDAIPEGQRHIFHCEGEREKVVRAIKDRIGYLTLTQMGERKFNVHHQMWNGKNWYIEVDHLITSKVAVHG